MRVLLLVAAMTAATCNRPEPKPVPVDSGDSGTVVVVDAGQKDAGLVVKSCVHPGSACCSACDKMLSCVEGQASPGGVSCEATCENNAASVIASEWMALVRCVNLSVNKGDLQRCGVCR